MSEAARLTIVNVGYRSTSYWVVGSGTSRVLVDIGYPGTIGMTLARLRRMDVPLVEIHYALATHYHIDHAGLAQELKQAGVPLLLLEAQLSAATLMKSWTKPHDRYFDITMHDNAVTTFDESRKVLRRIGVEGEKLHTPGHSDDSVSLLLDDGSAYTGDLPPLARVSFEDARVVAASWRLLRERGATRAYPGHAPVRPMDVEAGV